MRLRLELEPVVREVLSKIDQAVQPRGEFEAGTAQRVFRIMASDYSEPTLIPPLVERLRQEADEAERREAERVVELERQRELEVERRRQEAVAAAQRAEMEAELQQALAVEDERRRAQESGLLDEYIRLIENRIQQNWIPPGSAISGLECSVNVTQIPSGDVVDVQVGRCNGDDAVVRSIEAAVLRSSPLPRPPIPSLFERNLEVVFNPIM